MDNSDYIPVQLHLFSLHPTPILYNSISIFPNPALSLILIQIYYNSTRILIRKNAISRVSFNSELELLVSGSLQMSANALFIIEYVTLLMSLKLRENFYYSLTFENFGAKLSPWSKFLVPPLGLRFMTF